MNTKSTEKTEWDIDRKLDRLVGEEVRVAVDGFCPFNGCGCDPKRWISADSLLLPDNSPTTGLLVLFEGHLIEFHRHIGVVHLQVETVSTPNRASEGIVRFRGRRAAVLHGRALVRMTFPFFIERLPSHHEDYWRDFNRRGAQFELPLLEQSSCSIQQLMAL